MRITEIDFSLKKIATISAIGLSLVLMYKVANILIMLLFSIFLAYLLNPFVNFLEKRKIPRIVGSLILMFIIAAFAFLLLAFMIPMLIDNIILISKNMPEYIKSSFAFTERLLARFDITFSTANIQAFVIERIGVLSKYALSTFTTAAASVKGVVMITLNVILIPLLVFLLLNDFPHVRNFTRRVVERFKLQKLMSHAHEFEGLVGKYFRGMFLVGLILSALYTLVLLIVGVNMSVLLGIITGLGVLVPYVGFALGLTISLIMTAIQFHDVIHVLYVAGGFIFVQFLESFVITPKIVGDSLGLNPVLVIIALMIGGALFGFFGMILALPVTAFLKILMNKYILKDLNEK